jgi:asparagine synthase (glutamine-hydrolysing)
MCGIAGWYARRGAPVAHEAIRAQCDAILHRGPDDEGQLIDGDFGFGMRRLSIIDLAGGHQPMETADGRLAIVFNGEIYNHLALREALAAAGAVFHTHSDTETILAAVEHWGEAAFARLEGMFAIAVWDRRERRLTLARDPLGIKPLYISEQRGGLAFASELRALTLLPGLDFDVDPRAVHDLFAWGAIRTPRAIYRQVRTLPPGHLLTLGPQGDAELRAFWRAQYRAAEPRSETEWIEAFRERWIETVRRHMLADVEVGAFLSGGVDSSAVVAAMTRVADRPVRTFTIGFPVARYDESPHAEAVARHLGTQHTTRIVDLAQAREVLPTVQRCYGEPFADPSAVPTWYVSRIAREQVKVVLSGDGGDEVFMGYKRHLTERRLSELPGAVRALARGVAALPPTPVRQWNYVLQRWQKVAASAALPDGICRFFAKTQITSPALRARVYDPAFRAAVEGPHAFEALRDEYFPSPERTVSKDTLEQFAYADLTLNLPSVMLTKVDRASMAHSLEVRTPMLSHLLVDWALAVPADMKLRDGVGKYLLRKAVEPWLPPGVLDRRKQGFQIPLADWFSGDFGAFAEELWRDSGAAELGFLRPAGVAEVFAEHRAGRRDHGRFLFALSMFSLWWTDRRAQSASG